MSTSRVYTVGQVLTAAQMNDLAQGGLGKTTLTSNVGPTSGTTELDVITAPAVTIAGTTRRLKITFSFRSINGSVANDIFSLRIKEGATILHESNWQTTLAVNGVGGGNIVAIVDSPTAASHTYKATITRVSGTGTATIEQVAGAPIVILVEDIGQV